MQMLKVMVTRREGERDRGGCYWVDFVVWSETKRGGQSEPLARQRARR